MLFKTDHAKQVEICAYSDYVELIPDIDGTPAIAQLVAIKFQNVVGARRVTGQTRLTDTVGKLPPCGSAVKEMVGGLPHDDRHDAAVCKSVHDYLAKK